jgi:hypothetical protein
MTKTQIDPIEENRSIGDEFDDVDSEGYPIDQPREWSEDELKELRRRERACDNYGSM